MEIKYYNLHCSNCEYSGFRLIKAEDVTITADLEDDEYVFEAVCPKCKKLILNKRPMR